MTDAGSPEGASEEAAAASAKKAGKDRIELVATALLAIAAVATAWSSYQVNRWNGEQTKYLQRSANYVLAVVFFAGISTKLGSRRSRVVLLGIGVALFVVTAVWVSTFRVVLNV